MIKMEENKEHKKEHEHNTEHKEHHVEHKKEHEHHAEHKKEHEHKEHKEHEHKEHHVEHKKEHHEHKEHHDHHKPVHHVPKKKPQVSGLVFILGVVVFALVVYNSFQIATVDNILKQTELDAIEAAKPAEIQLTVINVDCEDCFDVSSFADSLASSKVTVTETTELDSSSEEAKALIAKHGIEKLPTVIVSGETEKESSLGLKLRGKTKESDGEYFYTAQTPPYVDAATGEIAGMVSVVELTTTACTTCFNVSLLRDQIEMMGVTFGTVEEIAVNTAKGKGLIEEYNIDRAPALIFSDQLKLYPDVTQAWPQVGSVEEDGSFVTRTTNPPYYDLTDKKVKGLVTMTVLSDETCEECYDGLEMHEQIMLRMGVFISEIKEHDASSEDGALLMEQYEIEKLPTILLTGDVVDYTYLTSSWAQVGTVEDDGTYVFRLVEFANQPYLNVSTGSVIEMIQLS
ncbi:MAG: hypothetical protein GY861_19690 [bacterium]|nr:hypothetical protein [bacterium]